jgi:hypothetical protein
MPRCVPGIQLFLHPNKRIGIFLVVLLSLIKCETLTLEASSTAPESQDGEESLLTVRRREYGNKVILLFSIDKRQPQP